MTADVTDIVGRAVKLAIIACLADVLDSIAAYLSRCAIVVALIEDEYPASIRLAINDVAIIANLSIIYDAIAAAIDIDADRLIDGANLP